VNWNIQAGNFFFRYRNALFPIVFLLSLLVFRPQILLNNPWLDRVLGACGAVVALMGELVRLATVGFDYIERGGKNRQVYASRLVHGGIYGLTRNPMYVGNMLMVTGLCMASGSVGATLFVIPFFLFVYQAIVSAEEAFLRHRFGSEYEEYCALVPRFLPSWRRIRDSFSGMRYNWRRAIRQDLSTIFMVLISLTLLPLWRTYFLEGTPAALERVPRTAGLALTVLVFYGTFVYVKKTKRLFYS